MEQMFLMGSLTLLFIGGGAALLYLPRLIGETKHMIISFRIIGIISIIIGVYVLLTALIDLFNS